MKIKAFPSDFIVRETADLPLSKKGDFAVYLLRKSGWNTVELLSLLSKKLNLPARLFSYGGRKDRHAFTSQYIAIKDNKLSPINEKDYSLEFIGFMQRPMGPDLIIENKFEIILRKLSKQEIEKSSRVLKDLPQSGFPNYFDDQRFGSFDVNQGFLAEKLLKKHFSGALKILMAGSSPKDNSADRHRKKYFYENWKDWNSCLEEASTKFETSVFSHLVKRPGGFEDLLKQIPSQILSVYFSAYQAFIWNEVLVGIIKQKSKQLIGVSPGIAGDYIFYESLKPFNGNYLDNLYIPTVPVKDKIEEAVLNETYSRILVEKGIKNSMFNSLKTRQAFFKSYLRKAIVKPKDLRFFFENDNEGRNLQLKFSLPRGSYGTMLVKRLFAEFVRT